MSTKTPQPLTLGTLVACALVGILAGLESATLLLVVSGLGLLSTTPLWLPQLMRSIAMTMKQLGWFPIVIILCVLLWIFFTALGAPVIGFLLGFVLLCVITAIRQFVLYTANTANDLAKMREEERKREQAKLEPPVQPVAATPEPPTKEEQMAEAKRKFEAAIRLLEKSGLEEWEIAHGKDKLKGTYLKDIDTIMGE